LISNFPQKFYRQLRHGTRLRINFTSNYFLLKRLRLRIKRKNTNRRLVVVMLLEHLGDIVACEPIVRYLREKEPRSFIVWGVKRAYRELIDTNPNIDMTLPIHCLTERMLLMNIGLFNEVIDLHFSDRYCSLCRNPLRKPKGASGINLTNYFQYGSLLSAMAQSAGLPNMTEGPKVYIPQSAVTKIDSLDLPHEFIAINCTSNAEEKGWPKEKWGKLLEEIQAKYRLPVFEIGLKPFIYQTAGICKNLCGQLSILESAEVIRRARLFIGIDSGPAHLANAVGTPGVILMGSYLGFNKYNPFSGSYGNRKNVAIVYTEGSVANVPLDKVLIEVQKMISHMPIDSIHAV
jgi:heptosyltransferase III